MPGHTNPKSEIGNTHSEARTFVVDIENEGIRLDAFLASQISSWSRARLQHLIADEEVLVNGKPSKSSYRLRAGDEIEVELVASPATNFTPEDLPLERAGEHRPGTL